ncbi:hypothetical protein NCS55_00236400 [Fusarium keratoplasticum]|nr:hypothetical protein NCS55_00236400 [Fusarium keratoplasticum]
MVVILPRFHLIEIEDYSWCPIWLREYAHRSLAAVWSTVGFNRTTSTAAQMCDVITANLPGHPSEYHFVDACAGAGGPTPIFEEVLNERMASEGKPPIEFLLTDLFPDLDAWKAITAKSDHISYVEKPVDATKASRYAARDKKELRIFSMCFHHFDDAGARKVLRSCIEESDAFMIFELTHRTPSSLITTTFVILSPFVTTLLWWWWSPMHLFFTYIIPVVPLFFVINGYVSCLRGRTPEEMFKLIQAEGIDTTGWRFTNGETRVLPPFGTIYHFIGTKE